MAKLYSAKISSLARSSPFRVVDFGSMVYRNAIWYAPPACIVPLKSNCGKYGLQVKISQKLEILNIILPEISQLLPPKCYRQTNNVII